MGTTSVDPHALRMAAQRLDAAADLLGGAVLRHLGALRPGEARDRLLADFARWECAARRTATALRVGADHCADTEEHAARSLR